MLYEDKSSFHCKTTFGREGHNYKSFVPCSQFLTYNLTQYELLQNYIHVPITLKINICVNLPF